MSRISTLRRNNLSCGEKKTIKLYIQPWGPFLGPLPGLASCHQTQCQHWRGLARGRVGTQKKPPLRVCYYGKVSLVCFCLVKDTKLQKEDLVKKNTVLFVEKTPVLSLRILSFFHLVLFSSLTRLWVNLE